MADLTLKEMEEILYAHDMAELTLDLDKTMDTVIANPHYEMVSFGLAVDGADAVREMYSRTLHKMVDSNIAARKRVHAIARNSLTRDAWVSFDTPGGQRVTGIYVNTLSFDPDQKLIAGENTSADPLFHKWLSDALGPDFEELPGVSSLSSSAPIITEHDSYDHFAD